MSLVLSLLLFTGGLALLLFCAEKLVEAAVGTAQLTGLSVFMISVIFIGFDPENLFLGSVASYEQAAGIALGTIFGAAMVAIALAFGLTALIAPMQFKEAPARVLAVPVLSVLLVGLLSLDGLLSRLDGGLLLAAFAGSILYLLQLGKRGMKIEPGGEVAEALDEPEGGWKSAGLFILTLAGIIAGSELLVHGSQTIIGRLGLSETVFGMTILALLVSIEEVARELPAALKGRSDISFGNVAGSVLAFFLFNAGIIAIIRPLPVSQEVLQFHLPLSIFTVVLLSFFVWRGKVSRSAGAILFIIYGLFFAGSYLELL